MHLIGGSSSFLSDFRLPALSSLTLLFSFLFSLVLLAVIRITLLAFTSLSTVSHAQEEKKPIKHHQPVVDDDDVVVTHHNDLRRWLPSISIPTRKWSWKWEGLPISSPISFSFSDHEVIGCAVGHGVGITPPTLPHPPPMMTNLQLKCAGPSFEQPR
jgi:hypothetical protein